MRQFLVLAGSAVFLCVWTFAWGLIATGSVRDGLRYLRLWLRFMAVLLGLSLMVVLATWPLT